MARRLALLALLACAAAHAHANTHNSESGSDSASFDPFILADDYDSDSYEPVPTPRPKISAKVILRAKGPTKPMRNDNSKKDSSVNNAVSDKKNKNRGAVINYTKIVAAAKPSKNSWQEGDSAGAVRPLVEVSPQFVLLDAGRPAPAPPARPAPPSTRRPPRPPATRKQTTRAPPKPTRKLLNKTKNSSTKRPRPTLTTTPCPPNKTGWFSTFFKDNNKIKKAQKKPSKATWYTGLFSTVYNWIWGPDDDAEVYGGSWFSGSSWFRKEQQSSTTTTTTTTTAPPPTTTSSWFQNLLDTEDDGAYVINNTKTPKKAVRKTYKGYQLLRAYPDAQWKVHEMLDLQEETLDTEMKWWTPPSINGSTDILVPPDLLADVKEHIKSLKIDLDVIIWDLQKAIAYENPKLSKKQRMELEQLRGHPMTWRRFHRYADILRYLEYLQHSYSDLVELIPLGRSSEGLPLVVVKVALPNDTYYKGVRQKGKNNKWKLQSKMKPAVWLEGGAHAREWIAPAVASWILHTVVEGEKGLGSEYDVLRQADFYIMPVQNPDGYEHSHTHDRLWRKTRSRHVEPLPDDYFTSWFPWNWGRSDCVGVDADRNWDYHWGEKDSSKDPCADNYAGPHPFSEPETRAVSAFLAEHRDRIKVYVSLHAYSQAWLIPSSHAHAPFADDGVLMEMGKLATAALADLYGTKYQVGTAAELRQPASGMSHDWAKARAGVKFSYHVNLRDSFGPYGFLLPGSQIVSTSRETWQAVKTIVDNLH